MENDDADSKADTPPTEAMKPEIASSAGNSADEANGNNSDSAASNTDRPKADRPLAVANGTLRSLQRVPPRQVNTEARLADPLAALDVQNMPLWHYLDMLAELSTVPITLDAEALEDLGQSPAAPVEVKLEKTTIGSALTAALEPVKLGYQIRDGQLVVGYPAPDKMRQVRYALGDLTESNGQGLSQLAALVEQMVAPASWQTAGGKATLTTDGDALVIEQSDAAHYDVLSFCEKLRVARGKPIKSRYDPTRFVLTTHLDKARQLLSTPITVNFGAPQPLSNVVNWLRARPARSSSSTIQRWPSKKHRPKASALSWR